MSDRLPGAARRFAFFSCRRSWLRRAALFLGPLAPGPAFARGPGLVAWTDSARSSSARMHARHRPRGRKEERAEHQRLANRLAVIERGKAPTSGNRVRRTPREERAIALYGCPTCKARVGEPCKEKSGKARQELHGRRLSKGDRPIRQRSTRQVISC
jgi:hypothetical protein